MTEERHDHDEERPAGEHDRATFGADEGAHAGHAPDEEVDVLRRELGRVREALDAARIEIEEHKERTLRARADLENARRRAGGEIDRAHEAGLDAALGPVLTVYDDLGRALQAAESGDPAAILPGVRAVRDTLERKLAALGVERVGAVGEPFDPDKHEALTAVPPHGDAQPGTIADVFEAGFVRNARLIRPARVVVYEDERG
ncbi:MAG: nucleotide exchange factor GrpE [Trueperaceae bacterium]|nr:nucleotide exchange factor GrpE [Trueperaceae bacterium]